MRWASRSPGQRPDSTSSARSATAAASPAGTRSAAIGTQRRAESASTEFAQPVAGRRGPEHGGPLGGLAPQVGRDGVIHQRGGHRRDGRPPPRRGHVQVPQLQVAAQPDRREQRGQVDIEVRHRRDPAGQLASRRWPTVRTAPGCATATTSSPRDRTNVTGAAWRNGPRPRPDRGRHRVRRPAGAAQPGTGPQVRGSRPLHARWRADFHPVSRPCSHGELADIATRVGPSRYALATRSRHSRRDPACRLTCSAAVEFIITAAAAPRPVAAKCCSIAR